VAIILKSIVVDIHKEDLVDFIILRMELVLIVEVIYVTHKKDVIM
jgi:hypothetical protein